MKLKSSFGLVASLIILLSSLFTTFPMENSTHDEVIVAVLDTGINADHPQLEGRVIQGWDFADMDDIPMDEDGHGTHVAGIILNNAPNAQILSVRLIKEKDVIHSASAILYAISQGADIINMSFVEPYNPFTALAIRYGRSQGVLFVASSGNQQRNEVLYPAKYDGVISVAAVDDQHHFLYGNYGEGLGYAAPGIQISSANLVGGQTKKTGTSMSAAYLSGVLAYLKDQHPNLPSDQLLDILEKQSKVFTHLILYQSKEYSPRPVKVVEMSYLGEGLLSQQHEKKETDHYS